MGVQVHTCVLGSGSSQENCLNSLWGSSKELIVILAVS